jgi:hypothetical protein
MNLQDTPSDYIPTEEHRVITLRCYFDQEENMVSAELDRGPMIILDEVEKGKDHAAFWTASTILAAILGFCARNRIPMQILFDTIPPEILHACGISPVPAVPSPLHAVMNVRGEFAPCSCEIGRDHTDHHRPA